MLKNVEIKMKFDIGTILTITHKHLLTKIENVYIILNYMLDENLFTHQLLEEMEFCRPFIFQQYPQLEDWDIYDQNVTEDNWKEMLEKAKNLFGEELEIEKVPNGVFTHKDPIEELEEKVGKERILIVNCECHNYN